MKIRPLHKQVHQFGRDEVLVPHNVGHAGFVKVQRRIGRAGGEHVNDFGFGWRVPVTRVSQKPDLVVQPPRAQPESAARRQRSRVQPAVAVFFDGLPRHDRERRECAQVEKERERCVQFHAQCVRIQRVNADLRCVLGLAIIPILRAFDVKQLARVIAGRRRTERAHPGPNHVAGRDRFTRGPGGVRAQMERVNAAVRRNLPALRQRGAGPRQAGIEFGQSIKQRLGEAHLRDAGDDVRVQRFRLGAVDDDDIGGRLAMNAGRQRKADRNEPDWIRFAWCVGRRAYCVMRELPAPRCLLPARWRDTHGRLT